MTRKNNISEIYEVIVAGAGAGGICAALAASRAGARTLLVEKANELGGTGVHSPVALVCKFHGTDHRPINLGIHRELFPEIYLYSTRDKRSSAKRLTYDESQLLKRYHELISKEDLLTVLTGSGINKVHHESKCVQAVMLENGEVVRAKCFVDGTADGVLSRLAGCRTMQGREKDGKMQSATLTFSIEGVNTQLLKQPDISTRGGMESLLAELDAIYAKAWQAGKLRNPKSHIVAFPYPDGKRILFNANEVLNVDPTKPDSVLNAREEGLRLVKELVGIIKKHPAFEYSEIERISPKMGVREGPRIIGDYVLTENDCLNEARFEDMVTACAYELDVHDPDGGDPMLKDIPGSGYYHIPYRSLVAADMDNILMGSRCISGTHVAHSSYRVISSVTAIGQAAGTAAALAALHFEGNVRAVRPEWIRHELRQQVQFVEGTVAAVPLNV